MGALSGGTRDNFELAVKKFARHLAHQVTAGYYNEPELVERLSDAMIRCAMRGCEHPEWYPDQVKQ